MRFNNKKRKGNTAEATNKKDRLLSPSYSTLLPLIATTSFSSVLSIPGGFNSSGIDQPHWFQIVSDSSCLISDPIAMAARIKYNLKPMWSINTGMPEELNPPGTDKTNKNGAVATKGNKVEYDRDKSLSFLFAASAVFPLRFPWP